MKRSRPPEALAEFWPKILELDKEMHREAQRQRGNFLWHDARDSWGYTVATDEVVGDYPYRPVDGHIGNPEDPRKGISWRGTRILGGCILVGLLQTYQLVEQDRSVDVFDQAGIGTRFLYGTNSSRRNGIVQVTSSAVDSINTYTEEHAIRERKGSEWAEREGLLEPTPEQYQQLVDELERGVSGEFRVPLLGPGELPQ